MWRNELSAGSKTSQLILCSNWLCGCILVYGNGRISDIRNRSCSQTVVFIRKVNRKNRHGYIRQDSKYYHRNGFSPVLDFLVVGRTPCTDVTGSIWCASNNGISPTRKLFLIKSNPQHHHYIYIHTHTHTHTNCFQIDFTSFRQLGRPTASQGSRVPAHSFTTNCSLQFLFLLYSLFIQFFIQLRNIFLILLRLAHVSEFPELNLCNKFSINTRDIISLRTTCLEMQPLMPLLVAMH